MSSAAAPQTKTFGKATRTVPHSSEKAQKWYPAEDEAQPRKVRACTSSPGDLRRFWRSIARCTWWNCGRISGYRFGGRDGGNWGASGGQRHLLQFWTWGHQVHLMEATTRGGQAAKTPNSAKTTSSNTFILYRSARPSASGLPAAPSCPAPS